VVAALCVLVGVAAVAVSPVVTVPDVVWGTAAVVLAVLYLLGVRRVPGWPRGRTVMWLLGCVVVLVATSWGVPGTVSALVANHVLLAVVAPVLLVLGGPVTLALRGLPKSRRTRLVAMVRSRAYRGLTQPAVVFVSLLGPFYLLYVFGTVGVVLGSHWPHLVLEAVALVAGYAFFWTVIGVDPGVRRLPHAGRVGLMTALLLGVGYLAVVVGNADSLAGSTVWALGELPVLVLVMVTVAQWARADERAAARADTEPDLSAYNEMLAKLADPPRR
jgi:putative copper resistance protein D